MIASKHTRIALGALVLTILALGIWLTNREQPDVLGQTDPPPENCEGADCVEVIEWPAFTAIYETTGDPIATGGTVIRPVEIRQLEWKSEGDWKMTVLYSEPVERTWGISDNTGSWQQQKNNVYTIYNAFRDSTETRDVTDEFVIPNGFSPFYLSFQDLDIRTDASTVAVETDICNGANCHTVGASGTTQPMGREYTDDDLAGTTFTSGQWHIPVKRVGLEVLELQLQPTTPIASACETNLRVLYVSENLNGQKWGNTCNAAQDDGHRAHSYVFELKEARYVTIGAGSNTDDVFVFLYRGTDKTADPLDQNHELPAGAWKGEAMTHIAGVEGELEAGAYTVEVARQTTGNSTGTFSLYLIGDEPAVTADLPDPGI